MQSVEIPLGDTKVRIETGKVARQADGAVWVQHEGTVVLVAAVASPTPNERGDFLPLTVDYRERGYAIGKIPGVYGRREPRPGVPETLLARQIDHCIRPLFPKDFRCETQVQAMALSSDQEHPTPTLALLGASAALSISDIPFAGPVGGLVVARVGGEFVAGPTYEQLAESDIELFVTGTKSAVMSVEGGAHEAPEADVIAAIEFAHLQIQQIVAAQEELVSLAGKPKRANPEKVEHAALTGRIRELATQRIRDSIGIHDTQAREQYLQEVRENVVAELEDDFLAEAEAYEDAVSEVFTTIEKEELRRSILDDGRRVDGRGVDDVRQIVCEVATLPRTHGSALFTRGQTQALTAVTLGTSLDEDVTRDLEGEKKRPFFLHYNFPGYSVGEVRRIMGAGRREIGHGSLAERALAPVIPSPDEFPYTVRVCTEVLESNSSSSMATVCGASLALMDAGVPIKKAVVGVGVGLIKDGEREVLLTDMLGEEDHLGDMDFKVAGTSDGVTAVQLDIKIEGITIDLMRRAIERAASARQHILDIMNAVIEAPRPDLSPYAPRITTLKIDPGRIGELIGPGGKVVRGIQEEAGVTISVEDDGSVQIASTNAESSLLAQKIVTEMFTQIEVGSEYDGPVTRITSFGAFIEVVRGQEGLIHISDLGEGYVRRVEDVVNIGDTVAVRVVNVDDRGRIDLEPREPLTPKEGATEGPEGEGEGGDGGDRRPPRSSGPPGGGRDRGGRGGGGRDRGGRGGPSRGGRGGGGGGGGGGRRGGGGGGGRGGGDTRSSGGGRGDVPRVPKVRF